VNLVLLGTVLTVDDDRRIHHRGAVYVHDGIIERVADETSVPPSGYDDAPRVRVGGIVAPGLFDLHNHLAYNTLPLWVGRTAPPYGTRYQWPGAPTYQADISNPAQALGIAAPAATLRYAEVKAAVGGVTGIQGSPPVTRSFPGWMVRNVENEKFGQGQRIFQSVLPSSPEQLDATATRLSDGRAFFYHLAEGTDPVLRKEFSLLESHNCVRDGLVGIHSTALTDHDFVAWRQRGGGSVVWSPFSNLWLYGDTTDVLSARRHGLRCCLGSDWTPSGTRNLLGELKVAARWNRTALAGALEPADLVELATANPGDTLARVWDVPVGRIVEGGLADFACFAPVRDDPWRAVLAAREKDVRLVIVGGRPVYGTNALLKRSGVEHPEPITVAGVRRGVVMDLPDELLPADADLRAEATKSWKAGLAELAAVWKDPGGAVRHALKARAEPGVEPFRFIPDLPGPDLFGGRALDDAELDELEMPAFDGLGHDAKWFALVKKLCPAHAEVLAGLPGEF
jgi:cytosine/adenosine deaminase-related metal-dependent hydrolase